MIHPLTRRQREIYDYCAGYIWQHGFAPSLQEIGRHFQLTSLATVHKHMENLRHKGYLTRGWNRARAMTLLVQHHSCPTCGRVLEELPS